MLSLFHDYALTTALEQQETRSIYLAHTSDQPEKDVVVTIFHQPALVDQEQQDRFLQESKKLRHLNHPHLASLLDAGIDQQSAYIISEHYPGDSLRTYLEQHAPEMLPLRRAIMLVEQIGQALAYLHTQGRVHGRLRPEYLLFDEDEQIRMTHWYSPAQTGLLSQEMPTDILRYLPPEQCQETSESRIGTALSDQYTLCCIAYELLTGQPPFTASTISALKEEIASTEPASLLNKRTELPANINEAVLKGLAKDPLQRYPDVNAFLAAFQMMTSIPSFPLPRTKRKQTGTASAPSWPPLNRQSSQTEPISILPSPLPIPTPVAQMRTTAQSATDAASGGEPEEKIAEDTRGEPITNPPLPDVPEQTTLTNPLPLEPSDQPVTRPEGKQTAVKQTPTKTTVEQTPARAAVEQTPARAAVEQTPIEQKGADISVIPPSAKRPSNTSRAAFASQDRFGNPQAPKAQRTKPSSNRMYASAMNEPGKITWAVILGLAVICLVAYCILMIERPTITWAQSIPTSIAKHATPDPNDLLPAVISTPALKPTPTPRPKPKPRSKPKPKPTPILVIPTPTPVPVAPPPVQTIPKPKPKPTPTPIPPIYNGLVSIQAPNANNAVIGFVSGVTVSNVRIDADLTTQGDGGGVVFRSVYRLRIGTDGTYDLANSSTTLAISSSSAIRTGNNVTNHVTIVAIGNQITVSVNSTPLINVKDSASSSGSIGVMAVNFGHATTTSCYFHVVAD